MFDPGKLVVCTWSLIFGNTHIQSIMKKKKVKETSKLPDKALDKLIDFIDNDIPYGVFCAILVELYWAL